MKTTIIIRRTHDGFTVSRHKTAGLNKGETLLATVCGGSLGRLLSLDCAKAADCYSMADEVIYEDSEVGIISGQKAVFEALVQYPISGPTSN